MSSRRFTLPAMSLALLLLFSTLPVKGQTYTPGVSPGNWGTFSTSGNAPSFTNVTGFNINIIQVSGVNVTLQRTAQFKNGSQLVQAGWINVQNGSTSPPPNNFTFLLTAKDLALTEPVYQGQPLFFNKTITLTWATGSRSVNYLELPHQNYAEWDVHTGFIVGFNISIDNSYLMATMLKTNMWSAPRTPLEPIQLFAASLLPSIPVLRRRRRT